MSRLIKKGKIEEDDAYSTAEWVYLDISSENKITGSNSNSDFTTIVKNTKINAIAARLQYIHLPAMYNVDTGYNTIAFRDGGASNITATITPGAYSAVAGPISMSVAIANALTTASAESGNSHVYTCSYNVNTYKFTITDTSVGGSRYIWSEDPKLATMLGFTTDGLFLVESVTSDIVSDLSIDDLYLRIEEFGYKSRFDEVNTNYWTFRLPLSDETFATKNDLFEENQLGNQMITWPEGTKAINELHVKLVDKYGLVKNLNGAHFKFGLKLLVGYA